MFVVQKFLFLINVGEIHLNWENKKNSFMEYMHKHVLYL